MINTQTRQSRYGRVAMYYAIITCSAGVTTFLAGYLLTVVTRILDRGAPTSVGFDVILGFHALALLAIVGSITCKGIATNRIWLYVATLAGVLQILFLSLNLFGLVWEIKPGTPSPPLSAL